LKVLIVDDEEMIRFVIRATLSTVGGVDLYEAADGPMAVEAAREHRPDLVFLDVRMPGMSGFDVCRRLKSDPATARARIVLVTAAVQESDMVAGREAGADDFVKKPFAPTTIREIAEAESVRRT